MVLDGVMIILACTSLTVMHPGVGLGHKWAEAKFPFGKRRVALENEQTVVENESSAGELNVVSSEKKLEEQTGVIQ